MKRNTAKELYSNAKPDYVKELKWITVYYPRLLPRRRWRTYKHYVRAFYFYTEGDTLYIVKKVCNVYRSSRQVIEPEELTHMYSRYNVTFCSPKYLLDTLTTASYYNVNPTVEQHIDNIVSNVPLVKAYMAVACL